MNNHAKPYKIVLIATLVVVISILHYGAIQGDPGLHILHRELFFLPILLASFWFGLRFGLTTAVFVSIIYAPHFLFYKDAHSSLLTVGSQILIFILVGVLLGWLVDRQRKQQQKFLANENLVVLGRAAAVVGNEMHDLLGALKNLSRKSSKLQCTELDADFTQEMARLERMIDVITSFTPSEPANMISHDLNVIIQEHFERYFEKARKAGIHLKTDLDENGCPSRIDPVKTGRILEDLIKNAFEASGPGQSIQIRSRRGGNFCRVEVQDQGSGIRPEHLPKMFTPFFSTKKDGQGLALAACRKILRDLGGDIQITSNWGEGALFTLIIPREKISTSLAEDAISVATRSNSDS
jgi:signal transduction histidine kinase